MLLLLMKGHPGVGKSSLASALAARLTLPLIDKDDVRDQLELADLQVTPSQLNSVSYSVMWRITETQLRHGMGAVVDCPMARLELYNTACDLAAKYGAELVLVDCECRDVALWRSRLESRVGQGQGTSHKPQSWEALQALIDRYAGCWQWSTSLEAPPAVHCRLDTALYSTPAAVEEVLGRIAEAGLLSSNHG